MAFIDWSDSLSVGYKEMDDDHKNLVGIINKLDDAIIANREFEEIGEILEELLSYTVWHFRHEERLMQTYGYPAFYEHKQEHDELTNIALAKSKTFQQGNLDVANDLMPFLKDWLIKHILETDMKTGHFLAENGD
ncbi:MAG: bacteriohemerythrin [gamma proteobacterium symbiont of Taylorina sp.]|nr:bacteriohemerythrin [gamma proteobacterium symbiont of Taylorina sp.]